MNSVCPKFLQTAWKTQEKRSSLIHERHLEQLPILQWFWCAFVRVIFYDFLNLEAEHRRALGLKMYQPRATASVHGLSCSVITLAVVLDSARVLVTFIWKNLLGNGKSGDWISNTPAKSRVIYWQMMTGDKKLPPHSWFCEQLTSAGQWQRARAASRQPAKVIIEEAVKTPAVC